MTTLPTGNNVDWRHRFDQHGDKLCRDTKSVRPVRPGAPCPVCALIAQRLPDDALLPFEALHPDDAAGQDARQ